MGLLPRLSSALGPLAAPLGPARIAACVLLAGPPAGAALAGPPPDEADAPTSSEPSPAEGSASPGPRAPDPDDDADTAWTVEVVATFTGGVARSARLSSATLDRQAVLLEHLEAPELKPGRIATLAFSTDEQGHRVSLVGTDFRDFVALRGPRDRFGARLVDGTWTRTRDPGLHLAFPTDAEAPCAGVSLSLPLEVKGARAAYGMAGVERLAITRCSGADEADAAAP